jgi:hypothetical protein
VSATGGDDSGQRDEPGRTQTGQALVLVVVVALVAILVLRHTGSSVAGPARTLRAAGVVRPTTTVVSPASTSTTTVPTILPADTTVEVLNGLEAGTLAGNLSGRLRADGYKTLAPNNATVMTPVSAIYVVQPRYAIAATKLASTLGLAPGTVQISPDVPATAPIPAGATTGSDLIVVIGTSLQLLASHPVAPATIVLPTTSTVPPTTVPSTAPSTTVPSATVPSATTTSTAAP